MNSSHSNSRTIAWAVWLIASVFYAYQYILRVLPNIMLNNIMEQFDMSAATFGQFSGIYYIGYSLMHLPVGIMLDRYGPKKIMTGCILLTVIGMLPLIFSEYWIYPIVGRFLIGIGASAAILGVFKIIRMTFNEARFPRMLSLSVTIGLIGAIYGGGPVSYMLETFGYQLVIQLFAAIGLLLAVTTYCVIPDVKASPKATVIADIKEVLSNNKVILSCIFAGLMVGTLEGFADVWGTVFFKQVYGFDNTVAATMPSMIYIGMCFGAPVLTLIADKVGSYLATIIGAGITMAICFSLVLFLHLSSGILSLSLILVGVCCAYQILAIYKASTYVRVEVAGLTTAVANMIIMIFGYVFHAIIGGIVTVMGGTNASNSLTYGLAAILGALCLGICGFVTLLSKEKILNKKQLNDVVIV
jgi:MFS family permease